VAISRSGTYQACSDDISHRDVSSVNGDISQWGVSSIQQRYFALGHVQHLVSVFHTGTCPAFNGDISQWDVSASRGDISQWDVSSIQQ
jgi:hypothetical protein